MESNVRLSAPRQFLCRFPNKWYQSQVQGSGFSGEAEKVKKFKVVRSKIGGHQHVEDVETASPKEPERAVGSRSASSTRCTHTRPVSYLPRQHPHQEKNTKNLCAELRLIKCSSIFGPDIPNLSFIASQLDNNHFDGTTIPASYSNMSKLLKFNLSSNNLTGTIPANFSGLPVLQK
ncbi:hypothetical protein CJ030_MR1G001050 [Morella rubra]|uniref:Uncharacterized protein n=1 Tax=Morella rubra TaxID=262757 RepID=A0A6A1WTM3_9ROSI|nr:hypothetical protein CJ030_MR1G001050 [Morella rubra]